MILFLEMRLLLSGRVSKCQGVQKPDVRSVRSESLPQRTSLCPPARLPPRLSLTTLCLPDGPGAGPARPLSHPAAALTV